MALAGVHCPEHSLSIEAVRFSKVSKVLECFVGSLREVLL